MEQAFLARDLAGTLVQVGVPTPDMRIDLPMIEFFGRGGALKPSWYGDCLPSRDFPMLVDLYLDGRLDLDRFVSETIGIDAGRGGLRPHAARRGAALRRGAVAPKERRRRSALLRRLAPGEELAPALLLDLHVELPRRGLDAPPGLVALLVGHPFDLVEARHGVTDVLGVDQGLLAFLGERKLLVVELVLVGRAQTGRAGRLLGTLGTGTLGLLGVLGLLGAPGPS